RCCTWFPSCPRGRQARCSAATWPPHLRSRKHTSRPCSGVEVLMATVTRREATTSTRTISGGHLVARALKAEGIEATFTRCGGHIIDVYDRCTDAGIRIIDVRHEQAAAHAADAWSRLTGIPGCAVVTAGPGLTDTVTAVANAWRAQVPMLLIGGQGPLRQAHPGSLQEMDHASLPRPITQVATTGSHTRALAAIDRPA